LTTANSSTSAERSRRAFARQRDRGYELCEDPPALPSRPSARPRGVELLDRMTEVHAQGFTRGGRGEPSLYGRDHPI
jgi:hypothetical protein